MNTKEVVEFMGLSQDTLRYYEKVGAIPQLNEIKMAIVIIEQTT